LIEHQPPDDTVVTSRITSLLRIVEWGRIVPSKLTITVEGKIFASASTCLTV